MAIEAAPGPPTGTGPDIDMLDFAWSDDAEFSTLCASRRYMKAIMVQEAWADLHEKFERIRTRLEHEAWAELHEKIERIRNLPLEDDEAPHSEAASSAAHGVTDVLVAPPPVAPDRVTDALGASPMRESAAAIRVADELAAVLPIAAALPIAAVEIPVVLSASPLAAVLAAEGADT
jgi:hypothetical protein